MDSNTTVEDEDLPTNVSTAGPSSTKETALNEHFPESNRAMI